MTMQEAHKSPQRFLIASILPKELSNEEAFYKLKETSDLVKTYGGKVIDYVIQKREVHDKGLYLGAGKINEISNLLSVKKIDAVILDDIVKPGHIFDIRKSFQHSNPRIEVWDRIDLILQIFSQQANTVESRLQIQLAAMKHMGPRIYGMGYVLSRQGGSIGTRGIGETNTELMKRHWKKQIKNIEKKLSTLLKNRLQQIERRRRLGICTVSIVGYTNAGKTSLFNKLTGKSAYVKDALFATLDSRVGELRSDKSNEKILISDTIGFINNLPASLIKAFNSTLLESIYSDLLIQVIDCHDDNMDIKIQTVDRIINQLSSKSKSSILVFNKADLISKEKQNIIMEKYTTRSPIFISVKNGDLSCLIQSINEKVKK
ncbi:MAG: GTPase HflX [Candidatus Levybacteria bacterium]|nr:GTPase HflX [Candidatus Levybacteria bacterium]